ncbi:GNAT family N-acetyltransferase [Massilia sp. P8910]|uniref:GNAT family N-acetyltransferase n=1 Tax=Massilia antarctica TaxID=2765360 RepID=UPI0006BB5567|nr:MULTISPECIES: GNAT family N-acetyltransferase [Massilia]MCE3603383.1 GNAT family N-acetyltransferase [Massilia antarctica]MCY0912979.1 GNAT family N-acetyltransferase [Massilia sp. H27-R4]CUI07559.1 IAA acetyltransferase [Janthinobacterium sp. CG23_2]CUU31345.1 IAA acetyltransferase [Janthinobacterium sp. CG23_2]
MHIQTETPRQPDIIAMLERLDAYCADLYPAESNHLMDVDSLTQSDVVFLVARDPDGRALGCGAYVDRGGYGEVKRMYVDPASRGKGVGGKLLAEIAQRATAAGLPCLKLETGISQPEAIGLYERDGFIRCAPFGDYQPDPLSLFMVKRL